MLSLHRVDLIFAAFIMALFLVGAASEPAVSPAPASGILSQATGANAAPTPMACPKTGPPAVRQPCCSPPPAASPP